MSDRARAELRPAQFVLASALLFVVGVWSISDAGSYVGIALGGVTVATLVVFAIPLGLLRGERRSALAAHVPAGSLPEWLARGGMQLDRHGKPFATLLFLSAAAGGALVSAIVFHALEANAR